MNPYYQTVLEQTGMTQLKTLVKKWQTLSESITSKPSNLPILLPDLFLVSHSGSGRTLLVRLLADYLSYNEKLMDFYGDVKYFEFLLNYCAPNEHFTEIQRLMTEVRNAAGFRNEFKGIIFIDIDEWVGHCEEKHFIDFLEYLSDNSDTWLVILSVSAQDDHRIDAMLSVVSSYLRIEAITIDKPTVTELSTYLFDTITAYGFRLDPNAKSLLTASVDELSQNTHFDGYKTVKRFAQDILYSVYSNGKEGQLLLTDKDLLDFAYNGNYISRMKQKIAPVKKIGF